MIDHNDDRSLLLLAKMQATLARCHSANGDGLLSEAEAAAVLERTARTLKRWRLHPEASVRASGPPPSWLTDACAIRRAGSAPGL